MNIMFHVNIEQKFKKLDNISIKNRFL